LAPLMAISQEVPKVGLQFSIHESTDKARDALIRNPHKYNLEEIAQIGTQWHEVTGRHPFFNYCAHAENTTDTDANRLALLFNPCIWKATVSVICERDEHVAAAHERQREQTTLFNQKLLDRGFSVRVFNPAGQDDIGGGCGQLWYVQKWMERHYQKD
jgi:23S rRNA (adenine2503-C2)-methyltransferase